MRLGLVHLADLLAGRAWQTRRSLALAEALGWSPGEVLPRHAGPCAAMGVAVPWWQSTLVARFAGWLRAARRVVLAWDLSDGAEVLADAEMLELVEQEMAEAVATIGAHATVVRWDGSAATNEALRAALTAAAEAAVGEPWEPARPSTLIVARGPPGPWHAWASDRFTPPATAVARALCVREGRPMLLAPSGASLLDLTSGASLPVDPPYPWGTAIAHDGGRGISQVGGALRIAGSAPLESRLRPFGLEPGRFAWVGIRCTFDWLLDAPGGLTQLAGCHHDWPCGHAKKLYGYRDNDPVRVEVAAASDALVSVFDVDAVVSGAVPLAWRRAGPAEVVDWPPEDPLRTLLTCPDWSFAAPGQVGTPEGAIEEDVRSAPPTIGLGPDVDHRYVVGLDREVWRARGDVATRLGGPDEGFAVYAADHTEVRRGDGVLLAAWAGHLLVRVGSQLFHEDARTGGRRAWTDEPAAIDAAVPVPWTPHAVLIAAEDEGRRVRVRLV